MIRAVVFDAVWTVIYPRPGITEVYQQAVARHCNLQLSAVHIQNALDSALSQRSRDSDLRTDELSEHNFWSQLIDRLCGDHPGRHACFDDLYEGFQRPDRWRCYEDAADSIDGLKEAGITMAIASNFDQRLHMVLDGHDPLSSIPHRFVSSEIGWRKPAHLFFEHVCRHLNERPESVLFVGDDLQNDVLGAQRAGCQSAWIRRKPGGSEPIPAGTIAIEKLTELLALVTGRSQ
ncbi:MAG: HAD family hydrolase [Fuerstiella sp.]|nr:HAD family hydrolase [Fuerstiella sp.]